jgi:YlmC/YmxH family sporulation protein
MIYGKGVSAMHCRIVDIRCKEVIDISTGIRLGFPVDVEVSVDCGRLVAIVVPGPNKYFGLFGRGDDVVIPWDCIRRIGDDIILVERR